MVCDIRKRRLCLDPESKRLRRLWPHFLLESSVCLGHLDLRCATVFRGCDRVLGGATCVFEPTFRDRFYLTIKGY